MENVFSFDSLPPWQIMAGPMMILVWIIYMIYIPVLNYMTCKKTPIVNARDLSTIRLQQQQAMNSSSLEYQKSHKKKQEMKTKEKKKGLESLAKNNEYNPLSGSSSSSRYTTGTNGRRRKPRRGG